MTWTPWFMFSELYVMMLTFQTRWNNSSFSSMMYSNDVWRLLRGGTTQTLMWLLQGNELPCDPNINLSMQCLDMMQGASLDRNLYYSSLILYSSSVFAHWDKLSEQYHGFLSKKDFKSGVWLVPILFSAVQNIKISCLPYWRHRFEEENMWYQWIEVIPRVPVLILWHL